MDSASGSPSRDNRESGRREVNVRTWDVRARIRVLMSAADMRPAKNRGTEQEADDYRSSFFLMSAKEQVTVTLKVAVAADERDLCFVGVHVSC